MSVLAFQNFGWFDSPPALMGVEIAATRVSAIAVQIASARPAIAGHATVALPPGLVVPSLTGRNISDAAAVSAAVTEAVSRLPGRARRIALVVPDVTGKVSLIRFEKNPEKAADLEQLVRWQMRKAAPFPIEDAQLSFTAAASLPEGGHEYLVVVSRRDTIREYETVCEAAGLQPGIVDLASFNLVNTVVLGDRAAGEPSTGDWLLVHLAPDSASLVVVRGETVIFFRNRGAEAEGGLADLVHQTAMYYEDRLGGAGFGRVVIADADGVANRGLVQELERRLHMPTTAIDPRRAAPMTERLSASPTVLGSLASPLGLVLREWVA